MAMKQGFSMRFSLSYVFKGSTTSRMELIMSTASKAIVLGQLYSGGMCFKRDNPWKMYEKDTWMFCCFTKRNH